MTAFRFSNFGGIYPRTAERLLGDTQSQWAENVNLTSGEIRPLRNPSNVHSATTPVSAYKATYLTSETWRTWTSDVDVAKGALSASVESRFYWTGDGEPRFSKFSNFGTTDLALGIPQPQTAPSVAPSGGTGSTVNRLYCYTYFSQYGEESAPSTASAITSGKVDGTWAVTGMDEIPINSCSGTSAYGSGVTTFSNTASAKHWLRVGDEVILNGDTLVVASIPTNHTFTVSGDYHTAASWERKAHWNTASMKRRLYRSAGSTASFQLVDDDVSTSYNDTLLDADILGDELISDGWLPPPVGLKGLCSHPSGAIAGFVDNLLCLCEPNQPHAWPVAYQLETDYPIVATQSFGTTVVAATASTPYMADGVDPASMSMQRLNVVWPCLSKRSMCSVGDGVVYATSAGLAMIGAQGPSLFTKDFFTETEWKPFVPSSMMCSLSENRLFIRFQKSGERTKLMLFKLQEAAALTTSSVECDGVYTDATDGELYVLKSDGVYKFDAEDGTRLPYTWRSKDVMVETPMNLGAARVEFKRVLSEADEAALAAQLAANAVANLAVFSGYTHFGAVNGGSTTVTDFADMVNGVAVNNGPDLQPTGAPDPEYVTFTLYSEGTAVFSTTLTSTTSFRLPAGYLTDNFYFEVVGTARVLNVKVAETMDGLRTV